jgi:circadian clock protein KaiB
MKQNQSVAAVVEKTQTYIMKLYISGDEQNSRLARENLKDICEEYIKDRYRIQEIDVVLDFASALNDRIFVTPTLVLIEPEPRVIVIGNLSDRRKVVSTLRLKVEHGK